MKLSGKLELRYDNNGIKFDVSIELNNENYLQAHNLFDTLADYVNEEESIAEAEECCKKCKTLIDNINENFVAARNAQIEQMRNGTPQASIEKPSEQPDTTEPELEFDRANANIEIPETLDTPQTEPVGNFESGTLSDAEYPSPNHCQGNV